MYISDFNLELTLRSGQLFTYREIPAGFVVQDGSVQFEISQQGKRLFFSGTSEQHIRDLFDLDHNPASLKPLADKRLRGLMTQFTGLRLIRQDVRQAIITFILSSNNNQKRIKGMIDCIRNEGPFPAIITEELLAPARCGYRTKYLVEASRLLTPSFLKNLENASYEDARASLMTLPGVGPKVADCILVYSRLRKDEAFPADVWVKRALAAWYDINPTDINVRNFAAAFGKQAAYVQQYLFLGAQAML